MDLTIKTGGEAGQGIQTVGSTLARVFARSGCHVFTHQVYESRVRGGHNVYQIRLSDKPVMSSRDRIDILIALNKESVPLHEGELADSGMIIYDSSALRQKYGKEHFLDIPFTALAQQHGSKIMANTVSVGSALGLLGMGIEALNRTIHETFARKGADTVRNNLNAARAGYEFAVNNCKRCVFDTMKNGSSPPRARMLISGNDAIGLGAVASGLRFYSAYPMTPSTGIMNYIAGKGEEYGIVVEQAEDEISAINMAIGASFAGARSMTGTSGGGFALMSEGLSLAAMTETPLVIALAQRPGPATGLPTGTEQGDLQFALYTAHGEFPRIVLAPGTPEQAFSLTGRAFDLAEKYQVPVIILTDQYLADSQWTYNGFDLSGTTYTDYRVRGDELKRLTGYKRHAYTENGISPLAVPGGSEHLVVTDSDEHDERGHLTEDAGTRIKMVDKRLFRKLPEIRKEMAAPELYGDPRPETVLVCWGSSYGVIREAVDMLSGHIRIAMLHFSEIYPFPDTKKFDYLALLKNARSSVCIENNATGQFARLMKTETGYDFKLNINRYDGRPFTLDSLLGELYARIPGLQRTEPGMVPGVR